jgi:hypothetical protein
MDPTRRSAKVAQMLAELAEEAGYVFWTTDLKLYNTAKDRRAFGGIFPRFSGARMIRSIKGTRPMLW